MYSSLKISSELIKFICQKGIILILSLSIFLDSLNTIATLYSIPYGIGAAGRFALKSHSLIFQLMQISLSLSLSHSLSLYNVVILQNIFLCLVQHKSFKRTGSGEPTKGKNSCLCSHDHCSHRDNYSELNPFRESSCFWLLVQQREGGSGLCYKHVSPGLSVGYNGQHARGTFW